MAIVFNYKCWTTHKMEDSSKCDVYLAFRGENCFEPTRVMTTEEYTSHQDAIARVQAHMDELALWEKNVMSTGLRVLTRTRSLVIYN